MLGDFYIPRLSNDMKIAVQKNHLVQKFGQDFSEIYFLVVEIRSFCRFFDKKKLEKKVKK